VLKAFFDPTQAEAMTYVRWGAAKFVRGQARFGGDNAYNADAEPTDEEWAKATMFVSGDADKSTKTTQLLLDMLVPTFPHNISRANLGAMLKRCSIIVNTKAWLYVRLAGTSNEVKRIGLMSSYIKKESGDILQQFLKHGVQRDEEEYESLLTFEKRALVNVMRMHSQVKPPALFLAAAPEQVWEEEEPEEEDVLGLGCGLDDDDMELEAAVAPAGPDAAEEGYLENPSLGLNSDADCDDTVQEDQTPVDSSYPKQVVRTINRETFVFDVDDDDDVEKEHNLNQVVVKQETKEVKKETEQKDGEAPITKTEPVAKKRKASVPIQIAVHDSDSEGS